MPKLRHYDDDGTARFMTFTCYRRHRYLTTPEARGVVLSELTRLRSDHDIRILGWVLMPEHVHLVLHPPLGLRLGPVIGQMKARSAHRIVQSGRVALRRPDGSHGIWQRRCYDYNCRTNDEVRKKIEYCHKNPVRRGLVVSMSDWPWSSYRWYAGEGDIVLDIDGFEE